MSVNQRVFFTSWIVLFEGFVEALKQWKKFFCFFLNKQHLDKSLFSLMPFFISLRRIFGHPLGYWEPRPLKIYQSGLFTSNIVKENGELRFVYLQCLTKNNVNIAHI